MRKPANYRNILENGVKFEVYVLPISIAARIEFQFNLLENIFSAIGNNNVTTTRDAKTALAILWHAL